MTSNFYIYTTIYLLGYIFAVMQDRKNDMLLSDEKRTNKDMLFGLIYSLLSWVWFIIGFVIYLREAKLTKFKYWLNQTSKF
jgi:phosphatidylglycerophosphatase A